MFLICFCFVGIVHENTSLIISSIAQWRSSSDSHEFLEVQNCFFYLDFLPRTLTNQGLQGKGEGISLTPH